MFDHIYIYYIVQTPIYNTHTPTQNYIFAHVPRSVSASLMELSQPFASSSFCDSLLRAVFTFCSKVCSFFSFFSLTSVLLRLSSGSPRSFFSSRSCSSFLSQDQCMQMMASQKNRTCTLPIYHYIIILENCLYCNCIYYTYIFFIYQIYSIHLICISIYSYTFIFMDTCVHI